MSALEQAIRNVMLLRPHSVRSLVDGSNWNTNHYMTLGIIQNEYWRLKGVK